MTGFNIIRNFATKRSRFVETNHLVKSKEVKTPPRYPKMLNRQKPKTNQQKFNYLMVLDFEATCQENGQGPIQPIQEIIEFPVVQLCTNTWTEVRRFHEYVRPTENPIITPFCTSLTGIIQEMVDRSLKIDQVLLNFDNWLNQDPDLNSENYAFVSCGDWDLKVALPTETSFKKINTPSYFKNWINVKKAYANHSGHFARGMPHLLEIYNLQLQGRHHSGIDDVTNICEIVKCLGKDGHNFEITTSLQSRPFFETRRMFRDPKNLV